MSNLSRRGFLQHAAIAIGGVALVGRGALLNMYALTETHGKFRAWRTTNFQAKDVVWEVVGEYEEGAP